AADERGRLAGAGGRLDDERLVERRADPFAILQIGKRTNRRPRQGHFSPLTSSRSPSSARGLRLVRVCEPGPQTGAKSHHLHASLRGAAGRKPVSTARSTAVSTVVARARALLSCVASTGTIRSEKPPSAVQNHRRASVTRPPSARSSAIA